MKVYISGGSKSGKTALALSITEKMGAPLYYIATMAATDNEDRERIDRHRKERMGRGFETIEAGHGISSVIDGLDPQGSYLLDSVTALLANKMFTRKGVLEYAYKEAARELTELMDKAQNIVVVSDFIYSDALAYDKMTELYKYGLAYIDKKAAKMSDIVLEACCGNYIAYKGAELLDSFTF